MTLDRTIFLTPDYSLSFADWSIVYGEEMYDHLIDEQENLNLADRPQLQLIKDSLKAILQAKFP